MALHDMLFTFAQRVGKPDCRLAETSFRWHPTVQPIALEYWPATEAPADAPYTAILSWRTDSFSGIGKDKAIQLYRMIDLPRRSHCRILLAIAGRRPTDLLLRHGWEVTDAEQRPLTPIPTGILSGAP